MGGRDGRKKNKSEGGKTEGEEEEASRKKTSLCQVACFPLFLFLFLPLRDMKALQRKSLLRSFGSLAAVKRSTGRSG